MARRKEITNAPLRVDVVTLNVLQPVSVLATGTLEPNAFPTDIPWPPQFNVTVKLNATAELLANKPYAVVLSTDVPNADYRIYGTYGNGYATGAEMQGWIPAGSRFLTFSTTSDLFFRVTVAPEPSALALLVSPLLALSRIHRHAKSPL
jgi:hypothetical protein